MKAKEYPMTFSQFNNQFANEEQCRYYLYKLRFPNGFVCPKCSHNKSWLRSNTLYECTNCKHGTSVTAGTIFQDTRKPLKDWFAAIWRITTQKYGASARGLQQVLGLRSYQTAWTWLHKIRTAMVCPNRAKLSGVVEVDEGYIGGEYAGKAGRGSENKAPVAVAVELNGKKLGRVRLSVIKDGSADSLIPFVTENIEKGSKIITDGWRGFSGVESKGYERIIHNQSTATTEDEMLPHVHLIISLLKRWLLGTHQGAVHEKHLQAYLDEYVFRFNRRKSSKRGFLFYRLLENAMTVPSTTYRDLVDKP
jgi:transposase-like protein